MINKTNDYCFNDIQGFPIGFSPYYSNLEFTIITSSNKIATLRSLIKDTFNIPPPPPVPLEEMVISEQNIIYIEQYGDSILFNDSVIKLENLEKLLLSINNKEKVILYNCDESLSFQKYAEVLNEIRNSIYKQREISSFKKTGF